MFQSPVVDLTSFLLTLLSLHPGMLEGGLDESACVVPLDTPPLSLSPDCDLAIETSLDKDIDTVSIKYLAHFARSVINKTPQNMLVLKYLIHKNYRKQSQKQRKKKRYPQF